MTKSTRTHFAVCRLFIRLCFNQQSIFICLKQAPSPRLNRNSQLIYPEQTPRLPQTPKIVTSQTVHKFVIYSSWLAIIFHFCTGMSIWPPSPQTAPAGRGKFVKNRNHLLVFFGRPPSPRWWNRRSSRPIAWALNPHKMEKWLNISYLCTAIVFVCWFWTRFLKVAKVKGSR